jgi:hypothetical protein
MSMLMSRWFVGAVLTCAAVQSATAQANRQVTPTKAQAAKSESLYTAPAATPQASAKRQQSDTSTKIEVYGFAQADMGYSFEQSDPKWYDVNRPSKLPATHHAFGNDGRTFVSARQSRFGVKGWIPTGGPDIKTVFEFDLFGVGPDAGQFTIRPRHIYGQWGQFGAGQTNSPFMDVDVFPNIVEYWGPNGMLFFRNVQVFWQPIDKANGTRFTMALERPGASGDGGVYADRIEVQNITPRFPAPDISAAYRWGGSFGYARLSGIVRWIRWDDNLQDQFDLNGGVTGWGSSLSTGLNLGVRTVFRGIAVYGAGVENYFNDAPVDVGLQSNAGNVVTPVTGKALPDFGTSLYIDQRWNSRFTTAIGYSRVDIQNSDLQTGSAFRKGQYASVNLLWTPVAAVMLGGEFQWAARSNKDGQFHPNDYRFQFSAKYSFSQKFGVNGHETTRAQ